MANDTQTRRAPAAKPAAKKAAAKKAPVKKTAAKKAPAKAPKAAAPPAPPPGWYLNPADQTEQRYWDGGGYVGDPLPADIDTSSMGAPSPASAEAAAQPKGTIVFRGRTMAVRRPEAEQIAVWKRIADRAAAFRDESDTPKLCPECKGSGCETCHNTGSAHTTTVLKMFDRALKIINSVLVDEADRDWIEDQLLEGQVDLQGAAEIVSLAVRQMTASAGRAAPKTGPTATRRPRRR